MAKPRIKTERSFDLSACYGCGVKGDCGAFALASAIRGPLYSDATKGLLTDTRAIIKAIGSLEPTSNDEIDGLLERFNDRTERLQERATLTREILTAIMTTAVKYQVKPNTENRIDDLRVAIQTILPEQDFPIPSIITSDLIDKAGTDIRFYSSKGICGALHVQEFNTRN